MHIQDERLERMETINPLLAQNERFVEMLDSLVWMIDDCTVEFPDCGVFLAKFLMEMGKSGLEQRIERGMVEKFVDDSGEVSYRILAPLTQHHAETDTASLHPGLVDIRDVFEKAKLIE